MRDSKPIGNSLLAAATVLGLGAGVALPITAGLDWHMPKLAPGHKGRSNNKPGARMKDRARAKAAHKSRMAQKRKK